MSSESKGQQQMVNFGVSIVIGLVILFGIKSAIKDSVEKRLKPATDRVNARFIAGPPADWIIPADERAAAQIIAVMRSKGHDWPDIDQELANRGLFDAGKRYRIRVISDEPEIMQAVGK